MQDMNEGEEVVFSLSKFIVSMAACKILCP